jgi:nucleotide-binding universal stress UspA family protein
MSNTYLMIWFLVTAAVTTTVLVIGTLGAADLLPGRKRDRLDEPGPGSELPEWAAPTEPYEEVGAWSGRTYPDDAVVVGYDGKQHTRAAVAFAVQEALRRDRPLVVLHAVDYPGMVGEPGPGLLHRDPGALEAAEEVTARGVAEARALHPEVEVAGATEITGPVRALREALPRADLVVVGTRGRGALASKVLGRRKRRHRRGPMVKRKQERGTRGYALDRS